MYQLSPVEKVLAPGCPEPAPALSLPPAPHLLVSAVVPRGVLLHALLLARGQHPGQPELEVGVHVRPCKGGIRGGAGESFKQ